MTDRITRAKEIYARFKDVFHQADTNDAPIVARVFQMQNRRLLAQEILTFLSQHGKSSREEPSEWNSPDAYEMERVAGLLISEIPIAEIAVPFSQWGSGGYQPYTDQNGRKWHDAIIQKLVEMKKR